MPIIIHPETLGDTEAAKLNIFFQSQHQLGIHAWEKDKTYDFEDHTAFQFAHPVIMRQRRSDPSAYRYEFISNKMLGKGHYASVNEIAGTLSFNSGKAHFKVAGMHGKSRVVKIQALNRPHSTVKIEQEYAISASVPHLSAKKPTFHKRTGFFVMRKLPGIRLSQIIDDDLENKAVLSLEKRIGLTKALLAALKEQVTDLGIIHRDIKGDNILVDMQTNPLSVKLIDYGLSREAAREDGKSPGTPIYAAPELFNRQPQSVKTDVFSLGRLLALLWHIDLKTYRYTTVNGCYENALQVDLSGLFNEIDDMNPTNKEIITQLLKNMMQADLGKRLSIDEAITLFEQVTLVKRPLSKDDVAGMVNVTPPLNLTVNPNYRFFSAETLGDLRHPLRDSVNLSPTYLSQTIQITMSG